jgi:hypothetical protein
MLPTIPLKKNTYTDGGFRLRRNYFYRADQWISDSVHSQNVFYDYMWYNTDNF